MAGPKNVEIAIKGRVDASLTRSTDQAASALDRFAQAQRNTAKYRGLIENQKATAASAREAAIEVRKLGLAASGEQVKGFRAATAEARKATAQIEAYKRAGRTTGSFAAFESGISTRANAEAEAERALRIAERRAAVEARIAQYRANGARFAAFDQIASGAIRADNAVEALTVDLNELAAAQTRVTSTTNGATAALGRQAGAARRVAPNKGLAEGIAGSIQTKSDRGPLGLRPYELTNLGYQVNDLITQIASGTSPMQAFAQQAGQIAQIFPRMAVGLLKAVPLLAAIAAVITPIVAAFARLGNLASSQKAFSAALTATADSAAYSARELARSAQALDEYGGSLDDARSSVKSFVSEGVDPSYFNEFGKAARNAAKVLGIDIPDASDKVAKAFTGNYDDVKELDDAFNFLTVAERKHIREMFESGRASEARTAAFNIFYGKMQDGANKMDGPWSRAINNIANAWRGFLDWLGSTAFIQGAISLVDKLARSVEYLTSLLPGAQGAAEAATQVAEIDGQIARLSRNPVLASLRQNTISDLRRRRETLQRTIDEQTNAADPRGNTQSNQKEDEDEALERQADLQGRLNALARQRAAEITRQREAQADFVQGLKDETAEREFQQTLIGQTGRQVAIATAMREAQLDAEKVGLALTTAQREEIERSVAALYDLEAAAKGREAIDRLSLKLAEDRGEVEERSAYIERMAREAGFENIIRLNEATGEYIVTMSEEEEQYRALLRQQYDAEQATRAREAAEKAVNDQMELRTALMENIEFYDNAGQTATADLLREQLVGVNEELLKAIDNQIALLSTFAGPEFEAALANLTRLRAQIAASGQQAVVSGKFINEGIADVGASAFDGLAKAIAEGTNAWDGFRDAFMQAAADFLRQIAQMIIQQAILNALGGGGEGGGGGVGGKVAGFISGLFRHSGGMVGSGGGFRSVAPAAFAGNVFRYHTGGIAGLAPDEVPAILKRGEEVLTEGDPRHRGNMGGSQTVNFKSVNVLEASQLASAMTEDEVGQKVFINFFRANSRAINAALTS